MKVKEGREREVKEDPELGFRERERTRGCEMVKKKI